MIVGIPNKTNLLALPRALKRAVGAEKNEGTRTVREKRKSVGPFTAFASMMERHADLIIRQMGE